MKVLQLCIKPPYPPVDGGTMAMNSVTQGLLAAGCQVKVLTVASHKHPLQSALIPQEYMEQTRLEAVHIDLTPRPLAAMVAMLCGESYQVRRYRNASFSAKLAEVLQAESFDVIHIESIFLSDYLPLIRKYTQAPVLLRAHNVEHLIWRRNAAACRNPFKRWYFKHLALTLRAYELEQVANYSAVVCITQNDANYFAKNSGQRKIFVMPFGVTPEYADNVDVEPNTLFHIGSMDWIPNREGVEWMLDKVWPAIHAAVPQARLYLAGRKMPAALMKANREGVTVVGEVPDAMYFIASKQINIVPLLSGSGIRVKIIEAMSVGKTVISTTIGAEGIACTDGVDILLADTPEQFAFQVKRCLDDTEFCRSIGQNASNLIAKHYNPDKLTAELIEIYTALTAKNNTTI
ncbi:MAG: glycosyltransferase family 4 protein [Bacteroidales bacterium]|nr:glycosyltransferase family 4 protein [Bacteroidales bacterium]